MMDRFWNLINTGVYGDTTAMPSDSAGPDYRAADVAAPAIKIFLVAAIAANGVLGHSSRIPWHLTSDLRRFRALTLGKPMLMGRRTYQSIGRPLPGRISIVLSRAGDFAAPAGVELARDIPSALAAANHAARALRTDAVALIGGAELFAALIDRVCRLHLTFVETSPPGDTFFPSIDWSLWREVRRERHLPQKGDDTAFSFVDFEPRASRS
jgi:dihydrofolate reductase